MSVPNEILNLMMSSSGDNDLYQVSRSLRCNLADNAYLTRLWGTPTSRTTMTYSFWMKRTSISVQQELLETYSNTNNTEDVFLFADNTMGFRFNINTLTTTQVFRDTSAWYHIVWQVDTTQATSTNRIKIWVNGSQVTALTGAYPAQNTQSGSWNVSGQTGRISGRETGSTDAYGGYLSEIYFIDGQALDASNFGQTDANGRWVPKAYTGTYGNNGFYLNFSDNSGTTATTLGKDSSGNGNNWTPNNFSVTAGVGNDSLTDTPTNYGTDSGLGGEVRGNYAILDILSPIGSASVLSTIANGGLELSWGSASYSQRFGNVRFNSGKWYYEWTLVNTGFPSLQCGWHSSQSYPSFTGASGLATGGSAVGYFTGANIYVNTYSGGFAGSQFAGSLVANDIVMIAVDFDAGKFWGGKNGTWFQSGNPSTGANPLDSWTPSSALLFAPWFVAYGNTTDTYANFGQRPFAYTAPTGFKALCTQNLPTPTIKNPTQYMNAITYTGTGATRSLTGVGFTPDLTWIKNRNATDSHKLTDSVRGTSKALSTDTTGDEVSESGITSFDADGFTIGSATAGYNTNTYTYVGWNWKKGVTPGFDIVTYTGNGANRTISHGLGAVPHFMIVKARTTAGTDQGWAIYHRNLTSAAYGLLLGSVAGEASVPTWWNSTAPTSSVFSVGTDAIVNTNNDTYLSYLWTEVPGFSKIGTYTGNGSTDGPFVWCGFRPKYLILKAATLLYSWQVSDSIRSPYNVIYGVLDPGGSGIEASISAAYYNHDFLSNGFKIRSADNTCNASTYRYVFAAFAEAPFKYSRGR